MLRGLCFVIENVDFFKILSDFKSSPGKNVLLGISFQFCFRTHSRLTGESGESVQARYAVIVQLELLESGQGFDPGSGR